MLGDKGVVGASVWSFTSFFKPNTKFVCVNYLPFRFARTIRARAPLSPLHQNLAFLQVWKAWVMCRSISASDHQRLRTIMKNWRVWYQWWKLRKRDFLQRIAQRALASAMFRWRLGTSASQNRREGAMHRLRLLLLRKYLLALADNAYTARALRRVLESYRRRALRNGLGAWGLFLVSQDNRHKTNVVDNPAHCVTTRCRRQHLGKPRKVHCRCVYAVIQGQPCTCDPRSHLLRRVEELHRLVAKGLEGRAGGHRLLSHVVQRTHPHHVEKGCPPRGSKGRKESKPAVCVRLAGGAKACGPRSARCGSDKPPRKGIPKPASSFETGDTGSSCTSVTRHTLFGEGLIDELKSVTGSPSAVGGPRYVCVFIWLPYWLWIVWTVQNQLC